MVIEVLEEEEGLESEENSTIYCRFPLHYRDLKILPEIMTAEDLSAYTSSWLIPAIGFFLLLKTKSPLLLLVGIGVREVGEHLKIFCFFLKPVPAE